MFFLPLIKAAVSDLSMELGQKKAASLLTNVVSSLPHFQGLRSAVRSENTVEQMVQNINLQLSNASTPPKPTDLASGMKNIIVGVLMEEHRLLGKKAATHTLEQMALVVQNMPAKQQRIAPSLLPRLREMFEHGKGAPATDEVFAISLADVEAATDANKIAAPNLGGIAGALIISFYIRIIQILVKDLDVNIGGKAQALLDKILQRADYYDKFLCRFDAADTISANVENIRRYISNEGHRLSKMSFINGFQQVIIELLLEERRLLGEKSTKASIAKVRRFMGDSKQSHLLPLARYFLSQLKKAAPRLVTS